MARFYQYRVADDYLQDIYELIGVSVLFLLILKCLALIAILQNKKFENDAEEWSLLRSNSWSSRDTTFLLGRPDRLVAIERPVAFVRDCSDPTRECGISCSTIQQIGFRRVIFKKNYTIEVVYYLSTSDRVSGSHISIQSKVRTAVTRSRDTYFLVAPLTNQTTSDQFVFYDLDCTSVIGRAITSVRKSGATVRTATWLAGGNANVVLFDLQSSAWALEPSRQELLVSTGICIPHDDGDSCQAAIFGYLVAEFMAECEKEAAMAHKHRPVVAHFHGWSASMALVLLRNRAVNVATVFTSHGCQLAHDLCSGYADFHNDITICDFDQEAKKLGIYHRYCIEKVVASMAHVVTAVSEVSAIETKYLLKRQPDYVTYNGLDFSSYFPAEQLDQYHAMGKAKIHQLIRKHFQGQVDFDLTRTQYFFFVSRYKFCNEGADMFIESLARLNHALKETQSKETVVAFFILPSQAAHLTGTIFTFFHCLP